MQDPAIDGRVSCESTSSSQPPGRTCSSCGARAIVPRTGSGRTIRYRNAAAVPIPDDFPIPACARCRRQHFDDGTRAALAPVLAEAYRVLLQQRVRRAIDTLSRHISQRRLEKLLGLSQGYLCRLRAGAGNPSPELVSNLALLAMHPTVRLAELESYWEEVEG